jgi:hypothetical protein
MKPTTETLARSFGALGDSVAGRHVDRPNVIEHNGSLHVVVGAARRTVEVSKENPEDARRIHDDCATAAHERKGGHRG